MEFGELYTFRYESRSRKLKYDPNPLIVVIEATEEKIYGINLHFIPPNHWDKIITVINKEMMKKFDFSERIVQIATDRQKVIDERKLAQLLFMGNVKNRKAILEHMDKKQIKSETMLLVMMQNAFRTYSKSNISGKIEQKSVEKYML